MLHLPLNVHTATANWQHVLLTVVRLAINPAALSALDLCAGFIHFVQNSNKTLIHLEADSCPEKTKCSAIAEMVAQLLYNSDFRCRVEHTSLMHCFSVSVRISP